MNLRWHTNDFSDLTDICQGYIALVMARAQQFYDADLIDRQCLSADDACNESALSALSAQPRKAMANPIYLHYSLSPRAA